MLHPSLHRRRPGAIAPLTALLLIPLVAMLAFSVDLGFITHTHNQLQAAADAAALAGASHLADDWVRYHLPNLSGSKKSTILQEASTKAKTAAKTYAGHNAAGDVASLRLIDADIDLGFTDAAGNYTAEEDHNGFPNTVRVTLRRDSKVNGAVPLFFARVLGIDTVNLEATARACIYTGKIDGFASSDFRTRILPMTYDVNDWNHFVATGKDPENKTDLTPSGEPQLAIYPTIKDRGNFGELSLDQANDGSSTIRRWIEHGITGKELQVNYANGLLPLSEHDPNSKPDWKGNPGLKTSTIQEVGDNVGEVYLLPLFKPYKEGNASGKGYEAGQGNGSNYYYTIVEFVAVRITYVDSTGNNKAIKVQPVAGIDPNAVFDSLSVAPAAPPTSGTPLTTTFVGAKLTQ